MVENDFWIPASAGMTCPTTPISKGEFMTQIQERTTRKRASGLTIERQYTTQGVNPLEQVEVTKRRSVITNPDGSVVFAMDDVEVPTSWSQLATDIIVSKYFRKRGVPETVHETAATQVVHRIANTLRRAGEDLGGYFATTKDADAFEDELAFCLIHQHGAFNSPVWFNVGLHHQYGIEGSGGNWYWNPTTDQIEETLGAYAHPQGSACFIQSVNDDLMSIFDLCKNEARLFKYGSGTGTNFSRLRGQQEKLSGGGTSSGLMSFLEVLDRGAGATKSGGTTRRAAKMVSLDMDHPEILTFINWKAREEQKVKALIDAGYPADFNGEAYKTVSGQNSNNSVRIPDAFMESYLSEGEWSTTMRTTGEVCDTYKSQHLMHQIADAAWACADPGVQFDSTINNWHTCKTTDRIYGSNPCSEYMFLDNTACNLASLNLMKFYDPATGQFDIAAYRHAAKVFFIAQEILVDFGSYPTKTIAENSHRFRPLGLGYANMGTLLMVQGVPYDSDEARAICGALTSILTGHAYRTSAAMAAIKGPFQGYPENRESMLGVIGMHREAAYAIDKTACPTELLNAAQEDWDQALAMGRLHGYRNAQSTVIAPTGCLVGGTLIPTERGMVRLQSLGDQHGTQWQALDVKVATDEGPQTATKFYVNGAEPVVSIQTARGFQIKGTPTHRIKVVDQSGEWAWRRFAEVEEGDLVPMAMHTLIGEPQEVPLPPVPEAYWTSEHIQTPRHMNEALAELVGYFMGDGSLHAKGLRFCVANGDQDVVDHLVTLGKRLFEITPKVSAKTGYTEVAYHSVRLTLWWEACGLAKQLPAPHHSGKGHLAHIPDAILHTNDRRIYAAFLRGLYEADGTVTNGVPTWTTTSMHLSRDVQTIALALGYPTTRRLDTTGWGQSTCGVLRLLNVSYNANWAKEVGFIGARKQGAIQTGDHPQAGRKDPIPVTRSMVDQLAPENDPLRKTLLLALSRNGTVSRRSAEELFARSDDPTLGQLLTFHYDRVTTAELGEEEYTYDLSVPENVTYIANGFVSHNTIGLLMDCDTTGIEPDFALVKFKKLAGGGYFKIINQSIPLALTRLGYSPDEITAIVTHIQGSSTLADAPVINIESLRARGVSTEALGKVEAVLPGVFDLRFAFNTFTMGDDFTSMEALGFTAEEIDAASLHICGTMTIEGAPHLKDEHLPIFDCANTCGKTGRRYLAPMSHIKMMAAAQPFISGAISKTINVPNDTTAQEIEALYVDSWRLGLKAVALYRDGSKNSQPLSSTNDDKKSQSTSDSAAATEDSLPLVAAQAEGKGPPPQRRRRMPKKRLGFTQEARIAGHKVYIRTGEYEDGSLGEIFIDMHKEGAAYRSIINCFAIAVSLGLQHGVPLAEFVDAFTFTRFEPSGPCDHPNIKMCTSVIDYIFRSLGMEYQGRTDFVQVKPGEEITEDDADTARPTQPQGNARKVARTLDKLTGSLQTHTTNGKKPQLEVVDPATTAPSNVIVMHTEKSAGSDVGGLQATESSGAAVMSDYLSDMMGDAPFCDSCGNVTVRNGSCYRCLNCGNSMGCS
jgi:ribonucleoside-diphosphate reductase alpha chain